MRTNTYLFVSLAFACMFLLGSCQNSQITESAKGPVTPNAGNPATSTTPPPETVTETSQNPTAVQASAGDFYKVLTFKNITFTVKATGKGSLQKLTIQPEGLTASRRTENLETEPVVEAEVADLNFDGFPELLVYTQSAGSGSYGNVIAYSVNKGKSMSRATFPATSENQRINKGYAGHDKFAVINNTLVQEFPIYDPSEPNSKPTGKKRIITYNFRRGEASHLFMVDEVKDI